MTFPAHLRLSCALIVLLLAGCGGHKQQTRSVPAPPEVRAGAEEPNPAPPPSHHGKPLLSEVGLASWYGPPYHNRKAANGEIYDMHQLTAAHKTLPLNSVVRVTNLKTGEQVTVRINDRGPFVGDRVIDLSMAAAKAIGVWRAGVARVRVDVLTAPAPLDRGGRWCVQIGAFADPGDALHLKQRLARKYQTAKVIQFSGPTGEWVRFRAVNDDRVRAFAVAAETKVHEGGVFLVRLD